MNEILQVDAGTITAPPMSERGDVALVAPTGDAPGALTHSLLNFIGTALENPAIDVTKLQALLDMQRQVLADEARGQFNRALAALSARMPQIDKRGTVDLGVGKGSYKFARWEDMDSVLRPLMAEHGFTLSFNARAREGGGAVVVGRLLHIGGHSETAEISLPLDAGPGRNNLQAMGSTLSYAKRYLSEMLLNLVRHGEDDDGKFGGTPTITPEQATQIETLIVETKTDRGKFMEHFGVANMLNIEIANFTPAINMLNSKKAKQAKAGQL